MNNLNVKEFTDSNIIRRWIHGKGEHTQRAYLTDVESFFAFVRKPLQAVTIDDVQDFADTIPATRNRTLSAVKSLLSFAHKIGYIRFNVGAAVNRKKTMDTLSERILTEEQVLSMIAGERNARNKVILRLLYASGARVSELVGLTWKDCVERESGGQITLFGKGAKTRTVLLSAESWKSLTSLRGDGPAGGPFDPVFISRKLGGPLSACQVERIVTAAARRAGIDKAVSPLWLRHAHVSHSLDRGCPVHVVQSTVGHASLSTTTRYAHVRPGDSSANYLPAIMDEP